MTQMILEGLLEACVGKAPAKKLLKIHGHNLSHLTVPQLVEAGLEPRKAWQVYAAMQVPVVAAAEAAYRIGKSVQGAEDIYERYHRRLSDLLQEEVWLLVLDTKLRIVSEQMVARGAVDGCMLSLSVVLRTVLVSGHQHFMLMHNHPSGDPRPSPADDQETAKLAAAAKTMGLALLDHIVFGKPGCGHIDPYYSYAQQGRITI